MTQTTPALPGTAATKSWDERFVRPKVILPMIAAFTVVVMVIVFFLGLGNQPNYTVSSGKSLVDYLGYEGAVRFAHNTNLPIYKGTARNPWAERISVKEALAADTNRDQISVQVFKGDQILLKGWGSRYVPATQVAAAN